MTDLLYFDNPLTLDFEATVLEVQAQDKGLSHVILDKTFFYPTGGGQSNDTGTLAGQAVVDVMKSGENIIHVVQGDISTGPVQAQVDEARRFGNMQAHTGQHLLSAAFVNALEAETVAVKMNFDAPSTVDISRGNLTQEQIDSVESLANQIIMANRGVKSYFLAADDPKLDELRRAVKFDKVTGDVRIVEIVDWDMSACAGTHLPTTGMLGLLKILKVENYKGGSRVHFVTGRQALEQFRHMQQVATDVSNLLSSGTDDVVDLVQKLQDERQALSKQVAEMQSKLLEVEKDELLEQAMSIANIRLVTAQFDNKPNDALKTLGNLLREETATVGVFVNQQGEDVGVVVCASGDSGVKAGDLLRDLITDYGGRGGGGQPYAQGICKGLSDVEGLVNSIEGKLREQIGV